MVSILGLNRAGFFSTETVQQIHPVYRIPTRFGEIKCKCDHGRLRWRAMTFYSEEPETIKWLESMKQGDFFWDIGANVGLYSIYAAKYAGCKVLAIEPEAQNYATLLENIVLNEAQTNVEAMNIPISKTLGIGKLYVHAMTKGGAFNHFRLEANNGHEHLESLKASAVAQLQLGTSLDDLIHRFELEAPTHVKIDVDGNEPEIISGAQDTLRHPRCKSLLIEIQTNDPAHMQITELLKSLGYQCISKRSNWESRTNREREAEHPGTNMIFARS
jgi:FkbM family methyltransferase